MDLYATGKLKEEGDWPLKANGIEVPRLRGYRYMSEEEPISEDEIEKCARKVGKYFLSYADGNTLYLKGGRTHTFDKRQVRTLARRAYKRQKKMLETFNKYCGDSRVLYVHARLGSSNWVAYGGRDIEKHPRYLERCDCGEDNTYCDIYFRIE